MAIKAKAKPKTKSKTRAMPHFGKAPAELVSTFESALKDFPMAQQRLTFGSPSATINGNMFAGLNNDKFILRLSVDECEKLFARGATPFEPMPGRAMKGWAVVPQNILHSPRELNAWMEKAWEFTRALPAKARR